MSPFFDIPSLLLFLTIGLCMVLLIHYGSHNKKENLVVAAVILLLFAVSRKVSYGLGGIDAISYENIFLQRDFSRLIENNEFLFVWFTRFIRNFTDSPVVYRFFCYLLISFSYFFFIKEFLPRRSSSIPFLLVVYLYLLSFNTMRNSMAVALILIGLTFLKKEIRFLSILFIISAVFVHRMSIVYVPFVLFYYLFKRNNQLISKKAFIIFVVVSLSLSVVVGEAFQSYMMMAEALEGTDAYYIGANQGESFLSATALVVPLFLLAFFWIIAGNKQIAEEHRLLYLMIIYDIVIFPCTFIFGMWRANEYMYIPRLTMWAILIYSFCLKFAASNRLFIKAIFLLSFIFWFIDRIEGSYIDAGLMPYVLDWF